MDRKHEEFKQYRQWRDIIHQEYSDRDEMIFMAGYTFAQIDNDKELPKTIGEDDILISS